MAKMIAALVKEQGVTFAVVRVKDSVVTSPAMSGEMIQYASQALRCPLVVLMGERSKRLQGNRQDVVNFVSKVHPSRLPWREWN